MGVVYRATAISSGRTIALKLVRPDLADPVFGARFVREARLGRQLSHPHIVPLLDSGQSEDVLYLVMAYIDGIDLAALLAEHGSLHPALAATIVEQLAAALDAAREKGLVHRDVKPANVLLASRDAKPHAYLADFGVCRHVNSQSGITAAGVWVGSLDYAAPEQLQSQAVDNRTDVYALGCVLYESLTGEIPFPATRDMDKLIKQISEPPPRPSTRQPGLPAAFDAVVTRAMAKAPAQRFATAGAMAKETREAARAAGLPPSWRSVLREPAGEQVDRGAPTAG